MFEEPEWTDDGPVGGSPVPRPAPPAPRAPKPPPPPPRPPEALPPGTSPARGRRRLLATLRRLEGSAPQWDPPAAHPGSSSSCSSGGSDQEEEEEEEEGGGGGGRAGGEPTRRGKKRRRTRRRRRRHQRQQEEAAEAADELDLPAEPEEERRRGDRGEKAAVASGEEGDRARPSSSCSKTPRTVEGAAKGEPGLPLLTRKQWRNRQKNKRRQKNKFKAALRGQPAAARGTPLDHPEPPMAGEPKSDPGGGGEGEPSLSEPPGGRAASLRLRMAERLEAARFRYLNQQLYSRPSREAMRLFREDPEAFAVYHRGFAQQMARWPEKPVQRIMRCLRHRPASLVVADFGCGDCSLARSLRNKVHCFDLVALDPRVTVCDMAQVPLEAESVDVAVFCLALMGTNVQEILREASRVLRIGGTLLVAEVASRFPDVRAFVGALARLGFALRSKDVSGSHFYSFEFAKVAPVPAKTKPLPGLALRPCLYKRR